MNKALTGPALVIATIAVALATFLIVLDYSIANVSLPYIAGDLAVSADQGIYVITSFAIGSAIILPVSGWLTKRLGLIRLMLLSLMGFTLLSFVCGISQNIAMLVIARFLQGMAAGPLVPLSQSIIVMIFPPAKKATALAFWSTVTVTAPILGPILGGWICYDYSWPWIFFINVPLGLFSWIAIRALLKGYDTERVSQPTDWVGLILLAIGVSTLQFMLDKGQQYDWMHSPIIRTCAVASALAFFTLIPWELRHRTPLLELSLLKIRSYTLSIVFIAVAYAIYFGSVVLIPLWLQQNMGYTPTWAGLAVAPIGILPFLFSNLIGTWVKKRGSITPLLLSFFMFALSCFATAFLTTAVDIWHIGFSRFLLGAGLLLFIVPLFSLSIQEIPSEKLPSATGMFHFVRAMVGAIGTSLFTTLWERRTIYHSSIVGANVSEFQQPTRDALATLAQQGLQGEQAHGVLYELVNQQSALLAINDCFYVMGWIFLALSLVLILGRKRATV